MQIRPSSRPHYGGYCAWATAHDKTASIVRTASGIADGKLYLNSSTDIQAQWEKDVPRYVTEADANWTRLRAGK